MQHISDNEFDRLFKEGLEDAEVQPSASLWDRIEPKIEPKKRLRVPLLWMAAASVLVALSAGLLFIQSDKPLDVTTSAKVKSNAKLQPRSGDSEVIIKSSKEGVVTTDLDRSTFSLNDNVTTKVPEGRKESVAKSVAYVQNDESSVIRDEKSLIAMQPVPADTHHTITTPDNEAEPAVGQLEGISDTGTALVSTQTPSATALGDVIEVEQPEKARIRNAGDLVNFVVDKIDKRDQKLLEFKTDDDDNSSLIAINIGPFKLNQRKHK
jgi:hypothetical protein